MSVFAGDAGGDGLSVLSGALITGATLVLLMVLALLLMATLVVWRVYRRVRRWRGWHGGVAAFRSRPLRPGPARDIARLRRDLRDEVGAAELMLSRAKDGRLFVADAHAILNDLKRNAAAVDADLASVQAYADAAQQRSARDALAPQVARLIQTSYLARQTMLNTEIADRERHLTGLSDDVERQAEALKIYRRGAHGLDLSDLHATQATDPGTSSPSRRAAGVR